MTQHSSLQPTEFIRSQVLSDETQVLELMQSYAEACRSGDIEEIMSYFSPDVVAFDMMPPLQIANKEDYRRIAWKECYTDVFQFPVQYDVSDLKVHVSGDLAVCHSLCHMSGTFKKDGQVAEAWLRNTCCLQKNEGRWQIIHDHTSVPVGNDGKALMNLKPESSSAH